MAQLKKEARAFLDAMAADSVASAWVPDLTLRWRQIESEIEEKGTYTHSKRELVWSKASLEEFQPMHWTALLAHAPSA